MKRPRTKDAIIDIRFFDKTITPGRPPSRINKGKPFNKKEYMRVYKQRKKFDVKSIARNMRLIKTRKQECTANATPMCLKVFITNTEDTVCLRCQNIR